MDQTNEKDEVSARFCLVWGVLSLDSASVVCSSLFMSRTMDWMGDTSDMEGKLECPKCKGRIGSFTWHGAQCSCGFVPDPFIML